MKYKAKRKTPVMFKSTDYVYQEGDILELRLEDFEPLTSEQPTQEIEPLLPNRAYSQQGYGGKFNVEDIGDVLNELITAVNRLQKG